LGDRGARWGLALGGALSHSDCPDSADAEIAKAAAQVFPVVAADLMPRYQGPALGARLRQLESRWIASGFTLSRAELLSGAG